MSTALLTPVEPDLGLDLATSYVGRLLATWDANPGRDVVVTADGALRAGDLARRTRDLAHRLASAGVGPGTTVALLTVPNDPAMLVARWAAHRCGATVVHVRSMNPRTDEVELPVDAQADVLRTTRPHVLLTDGACADRARLLADLVPDTAVLVLDDDAIAGLGESTDLATHVAPTALALVDFTSGTVNAPKLVAQSWASRERLVALLAGDADPAGPTRFLSVTPISHTTAPMIDAALLGGGSVVLHPGFDVDAVLGAVTDLAVTDVYLAVPHLLALLDDGRLPDTDLTGLRRVVYSGTPSAAWRVRQAVAAFGGSLVQVYGATETGGISALTAEDHLEPALHGTVGRPFPWVEVEIRGADRAVVPAGHTGEIHVRSETVMSGYLGAEDPRDTLTDGWVATGDLGRVDQHGYLELLGRVGGVIKTGGLKIYPAAVEAALTQHPAVRQAVVEGRRSCDQRERVHATISCAPSSCTPEELHDHVAALLSESHAPTDFTFWSGIPLTDRGKPDYRAMSAADGARR